MNNLLKNSFQPVIPSQSESNRFGSHFQQPFFSLPQSAILSTVAAAAEVEAPSCGAAAEAFGLFFPPFPA
jgi:hypothetical protein